MKRGKFYFKIGVSILLGLICVLFFGWTTYFLYNNNFDNAGVFATLTGIPLTLIIAIIPFIINMFPRTATGSPPLTVSLWKL